MNNDTENVIARYDDFNPKVREYMGYFIQSLEGKYEYIRPEWVVSLDLIAENLETIVDGYNSLRTHGDTMFDERHRLTKNPAINLINNSQNWIQKQLKLMGWVSSGKEAEMLQKKKLDNWEAELCGD